VENGRLKDEFYGRKKKSEMILDILNWVDGKSVRRGYLADRTINAEQNLENFKTFQKMIFNPCTEFQFKEIAEKRLQNLDKKLFVLDTNFLITHSNQLDQLCDEGIVIVPQISQYEVILIHIKFPIDFVVGSGIRSEFFRSRTEIQQGRIRS
jgi:hypothetical protein